MKVPLVLTAFIAMGWTAHAECLPTAEAVWQAHRGSHATWRLRLPGHEGTKCWFARGSANQQAPRVRQVVDSPRGTRIDRGPDRQENSAQAESQDTLLHHERGPLSILIWGTPMQVDPEWEEIFERRERGAE